MALRKIPQSRAQSPSPDLMAVAICVTSLSLILLHTMEMLMPSLQLWNATNKIPAYNTHLINGRCYHKIDCGADEV